MYEDRVRACDAQIFLINKQRNPFNTTELKQFLLRNGPYHVIHSHLQLYNGLVVRAARQTGVPVRIAHARNSKDGKGSTLPRLAYRALMRHWTKQHATHLLAVSTEAAEGVYGNAVVKNGRCQILTGIDFSPFRVPVDRNLIRAQLGIPDNALVVGHVGSFRPQKNHRFLLEIMQEILVSHPDTVFLLVGDGRLRATCEETVRTWERQQQVHFLGERDDVPALFCAMDAFVFPSLYEGLPRVLIEAQATGVPCIASDTITAEAAAGPENIMFMTLDESPQTWAHAVVESAQKSKSLRNGALAIRSFENRGLTIEANANELMDLYETWVSFHL